MAREGITRLSVDLTTAQRDVVDQMIEAASAAASQAAGVPITVSTREFFHALLKQRADALGLIWPEDYPSPGGWRGKEKGRA